MSDSKCVAVKCEVDKIFEKDLKPAVLAQMAETIQKRVEKSKSLTVDSKCKGGWLLTAKIVSLDLTDDTTLDLKVAINGVALDGVAKAFKANGSGKIPGIRPKKIEQDAAALVDEVIGDLMDDKVLPQLLKP